MCDAHSDSEILLSHEQNKMENVVNELIESLREGDRSATLYELKNALSTGEITSKAQVEQLLRKKFFEQLGYSEIVVHDFLHYEPEYFGLILKNLINEKININWSFLFLHAIQMVGVDGMDIVIRHMETLNIPMDKLNFKHKINNYLGSAFEHDFVFNDEIYDTVRKLLEIYDKNIDIDKVLFYALYKRYTDGINMYETIVSPILRILYPYNKDNLDFYVLIDEIERNDINNRLYNYDVGTILNFIIHFMNHVA